MKKLILSYFTLVAFATFAQGDIYLSIPTDGELIEDESINFIWQASSLGSQEDPRLSQELVVSEMKWEQTAFEAIEVNAPILNKSNIMGASHFVSQSNFPFEEGKKYAWQIRYYMNGVVISRSEAWWFEMKQEIPKLPSFIPLRTKQDGGVYFADEGVLNVSIVSPEVVIHSANVINSEGERIAVEMTEVLGVDNETEKTGNELRNFTLSLEDLKLKKGLYQLEWTPMRGANYILLFRI